MSMLQRFKRHALMRGLALCILLVMVFNTAVAIAQTVTTDAPAPEKIWQVVLKLAFPIITTAIIPWLSGYLKMVPQPVKIGLSAIVSLLVGAGIGTLPDFPMGPESTANVALANGATGRVLLNMSPDPTTGS